MDLTTVVATRKLLFEKFDSHSAAQILFASRLMAQLQRDTIHIGGGFR